MSIFKSNPKNNFNVTKETRFIKRILGDDIIKLLKNCNATLAGGCITSIFTRTPINDFDIYFPGETEFKHFCSCILGVKNNYSNVKGVHESDKANSYEAVIKDEVRLNRIEASYGIGFDVIVDCNSITLQAIKPSFSTNDDELMNRFDFSVCMARFDFKPEEFTFDPRFMVDLARKELHFNPECSSPFGALFRLHKYMSKGFNVSQSEILKIVLCVNKFKIDTNKDFIESLDVVPDSSLRYHLENCIVNLEGRESLVDKKFNHNDTQDMIDDFDLNGSYIPKEYKERAANTFVKGFDDEIEIATHLKNNGWLLGKDLT